MTTKHTPGTWKYVPDLSAVVVIHGHEVKAVADFGKCDLHESESNAKLISAAPDLLAALEAMVKSLVEQDDEGMIEHACQMIAARAAIAKAKGK